MIQQNIKTKVIAIWDNYILSNKEVLDNKGRVLEDIDVNRVKGIEEILDIFIAPFFKGTFSIQEFKTFLDSYNKQNNYWGFTAVKGQMFFNQLVRSGENNTDALTKLIKKVIAEPVSLDDALIKIVKLEQYCAAIFNKAKDKRKAPNPKSTGYFLSYFWQIHNHNKWPILYSSLIAAYTELGLWQEPDNQRESYKQFYILNEEIKKLFSEHSGQPVSNWEAEHAFWNFKKVSSSAPKVEKEKKEKKAEEKETPIASFNPTFELSDYLIPKVAKLIELGSETTKGASAKGSAYEKLVAEIFRLLDFDVDIFGQGTGRNPDAIIKFREENTAFIVDAKAYAEGYSLGLDDRAIREYINHYCPKLIKEGYRKIGFIIVSNSFKTNLEGFINEITWNTDIKRFILVTSEALLYLLAYKTKDKLSLSAIIESLVGFSTIVTAQDVIEEFDDV